MPSLKSAPRRPGKRPFYSEEQLKLPLPPTPVNRVPLQELAISASGSLLGFREQVSRPPPSADKENLPAAVRDAEPHVTVFTNHLQDMAQLLHRSRRIRRHLEAERAALLACPNHALDTHVTTHPRLSIPLLDSDDSGSEPDLSVLGMARPGPIREQQMNVVSYEDEDMTHEQYEAEDTSVEEEEVHLEDEEEVEEEEDEEEDEEEEDEGAIPLLDPATAGLKEISNLGKFTVSSHKQGNGVEELRNEDLKRYWQSDGPQPHKLTVYFVKRVGIRDIRFFVDYNEDESYTPTKIVFKSGTSENNLIEFATMNLDSPVGWQQVPIAGAGGDPDGNTLVSYVLQMQILENHQNGKDTHLRGIKIYAFDADSTQGASHDNNPVNEVVELVEDATAKEGTRDLLRDLRRRSGLSRYEPGEGGLSIPDFMREPEIR